MISRHYLMIRLLILTLSGAAFITPVNAQAGRAAREAAEYITRKFAKEAAEEGVETIARRLERLAAKHGDDVLPLAKKGGPAVIRTLEQVGDDAPKLMKFSAKYGDEAIWVISRPRSTAIFLKHGEDAGVALMRHGDIVEPVVERWGSRGAKALAQMSDSQQARRLVMMHNSGQLAKIGRTEELLEVISKKAEPGWADKAMDFIWRHKGELAVTAALTAFLMNPEAFINGALDLTKIAAENTVGKMSEHIARGTNWTLIFLTLIGITTILVGVRMYWNYRTRRALLAHNNLSASDHSPNHA